MKKVFFEIEMIVINYSVLGILLSGLPTDSSSVSTDESDWTPFL